MKQLLRFINPFRWPIGAFKELRLAIKIRKILQEEKSIALLSECKHPLRVDWLGRIYTVINVPEEYYQVPMQNRENSIMGYVFQEMSFVDEPLMAIGINHGVVPVITPIPNTASFHIQLESEKNHILLPNLGVEALRWVGRYFIFRIINNVIIESTGGSIIDHIGDLFQTIFSYV